MKRRQLAIAALASLLLGGKLLAADQGSPMTASTSTVLDLVPALVKSLPFSKAEVARITHAPLQQDASASNPYFQVFRSGRVAAGPITAVELRAPAQPQPGKGGLVILDIGPQACVHQRDVLDRFGKDAQPVPPSPHGPKDALTYLVYRQGWGELRFGFTRSGDQCLGAIVLDALVRPAAP